MPGPLQQGGTPQAHQARLLQSTGWATSVRTRPAVAHRDGGRDAGAPRPGRHALVDQLGPAGQPPPGADRIPALSMRPVVAKTGGPRLRPGIRRRSQAQGTEDTGCGSSCAGPPATIWPMTKASVPPGISQGQTLPRPPADLGPAPPPVPQDWHIVAVPVRHPQMDDALWLVVSRPGKGRKPWYLLTNEGTC